ncbi:DUF6161 domain-containing protein [Chryseobacterium culicis]|uniref:DUF6161 domain-containing protein n=1 Tax=Chryseobacterium culicis TaxID=680127 RepID=A0A1H6H3U2_CHRCI|nr:DUF6161 domain-containing protein [Chryseobacterium culicis]SEH30371.1 hypothetical protein SAMN05421593_1356 [Chryseobacterium culicis]
MELQEARKIIRGSAYTTYLNELEYEFVLPHLDIKLKFVGLINIFRFFKEQDEGWKLKTLDPSNNYFSHSTSFFSTAYTFIQKFLNEYISNNNYSESNLQSTFKSYLQAYLSPNQYVFLSESSEVEFLLKLLVKDEQKFHGGYRFFTDQSMDYNSRKGIEGYILSYEFANRENSVLFNRRESEKRYVNDIRNKIQNVEDDYNNKVISLVQKIEEDYKNNTDLQSESQSKSRQLLADWLQFKRTSFFGFLDATNTEFKALFENSKSEFNSLQNQYSELLKLQEPVKYWKDRANELNTKANSILKAIMGVSLLFAIMVYFLLWFTPEGLLESFFDGDKYKAFRWSFVFVIFVSIFFVVIKALLKYMFSNYHLARDAEEREKLTYLYISIRNNSEVSEEEKKIVFQALFSRSDTGLLKEDSSPTMPGISSIIEKNIK